MADVIPDDVPVDDDVPVLEIRDATGGNVLIAAGNPRGLIELTTKTPFLGRLWNLLIVPWTYLFWGRIRL